jgi:type II secretory pathway component PulF
MSSFELARRAAPWQNRVMMGYSFSFFAPLWLILLILALGIAIVIWIRRSN